MFQFCMLLYIGFINTYGFNLSCLGIISIATKFSAEGKKHYSEIALGREAVDVFLHHISANLVKVISYLLQLLQGICWKVLKATDGVKKSPPGLLISALKWTHFQLYHIFRQRSRKIAEISFRKLRVLNNFSKYQKIFCLKKPSYV